MEIKWLGHAAVMVTSNSGTKIIFDPFKPGFDLPPGGCLYYRPLNESADMVFVTHEHPDHNQIGEVRGAPTVVRGAKLKNSESVKIKGIEFRVVHTYHDSVKGALLGKNCFTYFEIDGVKLCHTGDLGHALSDEQITAIGEVDIMMLCVGLLMPVGERHFIKDEKGKDIPFWKEYVINADAANEIYQQIDSKVVIPIHYKNEKCSTNLTRIEPFLLGKQNVRLVENSTISFNKGDLPSEKEIVVLEPAL